MALWAFSASRAAKSTNEYNQSMSLSSHTPCNHQEASHIHCEADFVSASHPTSWTHEVEFIYFTSTISIKNYPTQISSAFDDEKVAKLGNLQFGQIIGDLIGS